MIFEEFVRKDHFLQASFSTPVSHVTVGVLIILPDGEYLRRWSVPSLATQEGYLSGYITWSTGLPVLSLLSPITWRENSTTGGFTRSLPWMDTMKGLGRGSNSVSLGYMLLPNLNIFPDFPNKFPNNPTHLYRIINKLWIWNFPKLSIIKNWSILIIKAQLIYLSIFFYRNGIMKTLS